MAFASDQWAREEQAIIRMWARAQARLQRIVASGASTGFARARAKVLLEQVDVILADLQSGTNQWLDRTVPKVLRSGFNWDGSGLKSGDWGTTQAVFGTVQRDAANVVARAIASDCIDAIASVGSNVRKVFTYSQQAIVHEATLMEEVGQTIISGRGPKPLAREIARSLKTGATEKLKEMGVSDELRAQLEQTAQGKLITIQCKDGVARNYALKPYSETVARSSTAMAQVEGTLQSASQAGVDLVQISVHSGACPLCVPIQGNVYSISGTSEDFPPLSSITFPVHPRCAHRALPAPEAFLRARGIYDKLKRFTASEDTVDSIVGMRDWLEAA